MSIPQGQLSPVLAAQQQSLRYAQMPQIVPGGMAPSMVAGVPPMMAAQYGYAQLLHGQGSRKNATRESTQQLKVWLKEHQKNPYPTKGEKIMLALMSGMSLTQVSTWFANARRRLKKENKWSPDGSCDDGENVSDSGASEDPIQCMEQRVPQIPQNDESGYSSSDRDSGSPSIPLAPPTLSFPALHPSVMSYLPAGLSPTENPLQMPRYMPRLSTSPTNPAKSRQARSLWSIADIAGDSTEPEIEVAE
jgi:hypothetical protein